MNDYSEEYKNKLNNLVESIRKDVLREIEKKLVDKGILKYMSQPRDIKWIVRDICDFSDTKIEDKIRELLNIKNETKRKQAKRRDN